jgi:hypothetical protein
LRGADDEALAELGQWWEKIQSVDQDTQQAMIDALPNTNKRRKKRRKRSGKRDDGTASQDT